MTTQDLPSKEILTPDCFEKAIKKHVNPVNQKVNFDVTLANECYALHVQTLQQFLDRCAESLPDKDAMNKKITKFVNDYFKDDTFDFGMRVAKWMHKESAEVIARIVHNHEKDATKSLQAIRLKKQDVEIENLKKQIAELKRYARIFVDDTENIPLGAIAATSRKDLKEIIKLNEK